MSFVLFTAKRVLAKDHGHRLVVTCTLTTSPTGRSSMETAKTRNSTSNWSVWFGSLNCPFAFGSEIQIRQNFKEDKKS